MAVDERSRHELHQKLDELLGTEAAATLMSHLPPVGWADVATKQDLDRLEERLEERFTTMEAKFDVIRHEVLAAFRGELTAVVSAQTRTIVLSFFGAIMTSGSFVLAAARLG